MLTKTEKIIAFLAIIISTAALIYSGYPLLDVYIKRERFLVSAQNCISTLKFAGNYSLLKQNIFEKKVIYFPKGSTAKAYIPVSEKNKIKGIWLKIKKNLVFVPFDWFKGKKVIPIPQGIDAEILSKRFRLFTSVRSKKGKKFNTSNYLKVRAIDFDEQQEMFKIFFKLRGKTYKGWIKYYRIELDPVDYNTLYKYTD